MIESLAVILIGALAVLYLALWARARWVAFSKGKSLCGSCRCSAGTCASDEVKTTALKG